MRSGRAWLVTTAVAILAAGGALFIRAELRSPRRSMKIELVAAQEMENALDRGALSGYEQVLDRYGGSMAPADLRPVAAGIVRLLSAAVSEPFTLDQMELCDRVVTRFQRFPPDMRRVEPTEIVVRALDRWARQLGDGSAEARDAAMRLRSQAKTFAAEP